MVTDRIIELLNKGVVPWKQTWSKSGMPRNLISKKSYRGINLFLLSSLGYRENHFLTFKQLKEIGGSVKKGERANMIVYWKWEEKEDNGEIVKKPFLRYYLVYNTMQCEGIPKEMIPDPYVIHHPLDICEQIIIEMPQCPEITFDDDVPYYNVKADYINMVPMNDFDSSEAYYETVFHEMIHATGHVSRLNRFELMNCNTTLPYMYSIEELTAELGACYLKSLAGLGNSFENNASYLDSWLKKLKENKRWIVSAAAKAQKAVDFILNIAPVVVTETVEEEEEL
jgi:antirestriction protein ArdC